MVFAYSKEINPKNRNTDEKIPNTNREHLKIGTTVTYLND